MTHRITADNGGIPITLAPETLIEEIIQNVAMILGTVRMTAPLFRDFGISATFIDKPTVAAEALLIADLFDAIERFEPRAEIINVSFERDEMAGILTPILEVSINAG
jgi:hypothetical protein